MFENEINYFGDQAFAINGKESDFLTKEILESVPKKLSKIQNKNFDSKKAKVNIVLIKFIFNEIDRLWKN